MGSLVEFNIDINREIQELEYLGIEESEGIQYQQMKGRTNKEYTRRSKMRLKTELNVKNKITASGTPAVLPLKCSFDLFSWRLE